MYHSFKRSNAKLAKQLQRTTTSAITTLWDNLLPPATPKKRKVTSAASKVPARPAKTKVTTQPAVSKTPRQAKALPPATSKARTTTPRGASFGAGVHVCAYGERSYRLYVPTFAKTAQNPLQVLVMLHGCNQTPEDFARGTGMNVLAEEFGFLVVYPAQPRKSQTNRCWNWFKRSDQARGAGEPALIASLTRHIIGEYEANPARVYIAGLSAGASAALITAIAYPDIFAAVGVHSGLPQGAAHDAASALVAMKYGAFGRSHATPTPTISFHGDADTVVNARNGRFVSARAAEPYPHLRKTEKHGHAPGSRTYTKTSHRLGKGRSFVEHWLINGAGHAWSGGHKAGGYTDPTGPDASREMVRFFRQHRTTKKGRASFSK